MTSEYDVDEREIRGRLHNGDLFTIVARQWPGGLLLDPIRQLGVDELAGFHSVTQANLNDPPWGVHAKEVETADSVFIVADGEKANVSFGMAAARSGAFTPVYLRAFEFDVQE